MGAIQAKYNKVSGSAVNPVLREGNSDRRSAVPIKNYAKKYPHEMGKWTPQTKTHVSHMESGDFFGNEVSMAVSKCEARIEHVGADGAVTVLKEKLALQDGDVLVAHEGYHDEGVRPYYFRTLCERVLQGRVREAWVNIREAGRECQQRPR